MAALSPGTRLGPYEVVAPLGAGGMGEVYRAKDTRLGRDVAIKVLPEHLSAQPEIRARFEREAKTVSSLNHPNICTLFDVGRENETDYLVMELIEGETLTDRLRHGPMTSPELLRLGTQIADALDRAHRAGVVHRDLKPGNVMITRSGAKLMDFGLSRVTGLAGSGGGSSRTLTALTQSPTMAQALTAEGTLLGTFQYMSPEQLEGKDADTRSDLWALGCVLYEMATGRRAFEGRSQASLIAAILERQPMPIGEPPSGASNIPGGPPAGLDRLVRNCLAKDPDERIQTAHDVKLQLQGIAEGVGLSATSVAASSVAGAPAMAMARSGATLAWAVAAVAVVAAAGIAGWALMRRPAPPLPVRFRLGEIPGTTNYYWPRVSPDGRFILLLGLDSTGTAQAYVRPIDQIEAVPIPGTRGLRRPYWSPDGREIAFVTGDKLMRAPVGGGSPSVIGAAEGGVDLSWGSKGVLLIDGRFNDSLNSVPASGGAMRPASRIDRAAGEVGSSWPSFLPDGEHFLFIGNLRGSVGSSNIRLGKLGSLDSKLLGRSDGRVEYAPGGWVLYVRGRTLLAQKLDLGAGKLTGEPITLSDNLRVGSAAGHFSASPSGVLAYSPQSGSEEVSIEVWDRTGKPLRPPLVTGRLLSPQLSPDETRLLYVRPIIAAQSDGDISVLDLSRGTDTRLTSTGGLACSPRWSPDGRRFAYVTRPTHGAPRIRIASADGLGGEDSLSTPRRSSGALAQWAPDGTRLLYLTPELQLWGVPVAGPDGAAIPLVDTTTVNAHAKLSPDGRWLAACQGRMPNVHIFVQGVGDRGGRWQISTTPSMQPRWTKGGRELIFEGFDQQLMVVDLEAGEGFRASAPRKLFKLPLATPSADDNAWTCDAKGERFYLLVPPAGGQPGAIEVVSDFSSLVNRK